MIVSILMVGLVSCIHMVTRAAALADGPASKTSDTARVMEEVLTDLRLAQVFTERTSDAVEFTIPDRDGDDTPEIVRYQWVGDPAFELQKTIDFSDDPTPPVPATVAAGVREFDLEYLTREWGNAAPEREIESDEMLLAVHDLRPWQNRNRVLMVVQDAGSLNARESARMAMLQGWGFAVETIGAGQSQADINSAVGRNDVAYVSSTVSAAALGTKFRGADIGVVTEPAGLTDEFGFASAPGSIQSASMVDHNVGTHYIPQGFLPGAGVTLFSSNQPLHTLASNANLLASDIQVLASRGAGASVAVLDHEAELYLPPNGPQLTVGLTSNPSNDTGASEFQKAYLATQWELSTAARGIRMSAYLMARSNRWLRYGIYADNNGEPGALVAQTPSTYCTQRGRLWFSIDFTDKVVLPAGKYWLAVAMQDNVEIGYESAGGQSRHAWFDEDPRDPMQSVWGNTYGPNPNNRRYAINLEYYETTVAPARRVQLPWGDPNVDIGALNDQGRGLLRRSLEWASEVGPENQGTPASITSHVWQSQYMIPQLPTNATGWQITRAFVRMRAPESGSGKVRFGLAHANLTEQPSSFVLQYTSEINSSTWSRGKYQWYEVPLDVTRDLPPDSGVCLLLRGNTSSPSARVCYDSGAPWMSPGTHKVTSSNEGSHWTMPDDAADIRYYVYGRYFTQGDPVW